MPISPTPEGAKRGRDFLERNGIDPSRVVMDSWDEYGYSTPCRKIMGDEEVLRLVEVPWPPGFNYLAFLGALNGEPEEEG